MIAKRGLVMVRTYNLSTSKVEARGSEVPLVRSSEWASLLYIRPCIEKEKEIIPAEHVLLGPHL